MMAAASAKNAAKSQFNFPHSLNQHPSLSLQLIRNVVKDQTVNALFFYFSFPFRPLIGGAFYALAFAVGITSVVSAQNGPPPAVTKSTDTSETSSSQAAPLEAVDPAGDGPAVPIAAAQTTATQTKPTQSTVEAKPGELPVDPNWTRLSPDQPIWIDQKKKAVIVAGEICHREGPLEMFACPKGTKDYESVVAVHCQSFLVHTALLAVGAKPGHPVEFDKVYKPAEGQLIDVFVEWLDASGTKQRVRAQEFVRHAPSGKTMSYDWIFAGSGFWTDEQTGERYYHAEGGELICVSNFSTATMDVTVRSSQGNSELLFDAFTEHIPPLGTPVHLILVPRPEKAAESGNPQR